MQEILAAIRQLIEQKLTNTELSEKLIPDHFRSLFNDIEGESLPVMRLKLVEYAEKHREVPKLLKEIQHLNPLGYQAFIDDLNRGKQDLFSQWNSENNEENRNRLYQEIELKEEVISTLKLQNFTDKQLNLREYWDNKLIEIDFARAKKLIEEIRRDYLDTVNHRYALFLLDNTVAMEGELILKWTRNYLRGCGTWTEPLIHGFAITANKEEFIRSLANRCAIPVDVEVGVLINKLKSKFRLGEVFFIQIEIPNDNASEFVSWFVQDFWHPFTQDLNGDFAVVATIAIDCRFQGAGLPDNIFCKGKFDGRKIKRLPLKNWSQDDVISWLRDHSDLGVRGCSMQQFQEIARGVYDFARGKPIDTRSALLKNLNRLVSRTIR
jgi:L-rhamnose mutarotase